MVRWSLCAWSELNFLLRCDTRGWLHLGKRRVTEGAVHKSFLDIAASLPQTHFLPASLCLSSKLHNPCQSCLDCRLKVIHKHGGGGGRRRMDGEDYNLPCTKLCSTHSYDNYVLRAFTLSIFLFFLFFFGAENVQMELACNYNTPSLENRALHQHTGGPIVGFLSPEFSTRNVNLMDLSQGQIWKLWLKTERCYGSKCWACKSKTIKKKKTECSGGEWNTACEGCNLKPCKNTFLVSGKLYQARGQR